MARIVSMLLKYLLVSAFYPIMMNKDVYINTYFNVLKQILQLIGLFTIKYSLTYSTVSESLGGSVCFQACVLSIKRLWADDW